MSDSHGGSDFTPPTDDAEAVAPTAPPAPESVDGRSAPGTVDDPTGSGPGDGPHPDPTVGDDVEQGLEDGADALAADGPTAPRAGAGNTGPAPMAAPTGGLGPGAEAERFGHTVRQYRMGVSGAALALAWARQENAPNGATVVVEREVSPLGRLGKMWLPPPESTLSCAIVLRPPLSVEEADATWLLAGVAAAEGAEAASGRKLATWWPDLVVDAETGDPVAALKVEIQLGPGKVRSAVASIRLDLEKLGIGADGRDALLEAVLTALDRNSETLGEGSGGVAAAYDGRCGLLGRRVKLRLLPKGETRGLARRVDRTARLELESATGMVQRVAIDNLRELEAV